MRQASNPGASELNPIMIWLPSFPNNTLPPKQMFPQMVPFQKDPVLEHHNIPREFGDS